MAGFRRDGHIFKNEESRELQDNRWSKFYERLC